MVSKSPSPHPTPFNSCSNNIFTVQICSVKLSSHMGSCCMRQDTKWSNLCWACISVNKCSVLEPRLSDPAKDKSRKEGRAIAFFTHTGMCEGLNLAHSNPNLSVYCLENLEWTRVKFKSKVKVDVPSINLLNEFLYGIQHFSWRLGKPLCDASVAWFA